VGVCSIMKAKYYIEKYGIAPEMATELEERDLKSEQTFDEACQRALMVVRAKIAEEERLKKAETIGKFPAAGPK